MIGSVKNWKKFQHFKDRKPPWIKLYRYLLDDPEWFSLSGDAAKMLVMLWLIASETDGYLPDINVISFRLRVSEQECKSLLLKLKHWLDISMISERYQDDIPETETETDIHPLPLKGDDGLLPLIVAEPEQKPFTKWTLEEFIADCNRANQPEILKPIELQSFIRHWTQKNAKGKFGFSIEKTWETRARLFNSLKMIYAKDRPKEQTETARPTKVCL